MNTIRGWLQCTSAVGRWWILCHRFVFSSTAVCHQCTGDDWAGIRRWVQPACPYRQWILAVQEHCPEVHCSSQRRVETADRHDGTLVFDQWGCRANAINRAAMGVVWFCAMGGAEVGTIRREATAHGQRHLIVWGSAICKGIKFRSSSLILQQRTAWMGQLNDGPQYGMNESSCI